MLFSLNSSFMKTKKRIGIIGDYNPDNPTHVATNEAIHTPPKSLEESFESSWLATDQPQQFDDIRDCSAAPAAPTRALKARCTVSSSHVSRRFPFSARAAVHSIWSLNMREV